MTPYSPFLIAPFGTGLDTDIAPWLAPQDAFSDVENGHIHHGVAEKRSGYTKHGDIVYQDQTNWKITGVTFSSICALTLTDVTGFIIGDTVEVRNVTGTTQLNGSQYTVLTVNGAAGGTIQLKDVNSVSFSAYSGGGDVYKIPGTRVMGLHRYIDSDNVKHILAFDQYRACIYNTTSDAFDPLDSVDIMDLKSSGNTNSDYVWADNWASTASSIAATQYRLYFTNGLPYVPASVGPTVPEKNGIRYYDSGTTTTIFRPEINTGSAVFVDGCKLMFAFKQRLLLLHTFEGAGLGATTTYPQRARWCQAQGPSITGAWNDSGAGNGGFVDAPTGDHIISAEFVQDILIVFFTSSVWTLRATADPGLPFRWDKVNDFRSCDGKMNVSQYDRFVLSAGTRGITATDGSGTQRIDERIEDFVGKTVNNSQFDKTFSKRSFSSRRLWMLYPSGESSDADHALIYDDESSAFSKYKISMNVLGDGGAAKDSTIADFGDKTIDQFSDNTLQDFFYDDGAETLIGGNRSGQIFTLETGGDDNEIIFKATIANVDLSVANVVTVVMSGDVGLSDGNVISISGIGATSTVELNDKFFIVEGKSGNSFNLAGQDPADYTAYNSAVDRGAIGSTLSDSIEFSLTSAAWNPWMSEGAQCQFGYIDLFLETHMTTELKVEFFTNNSNSPYLEKQLNVLPNLVERSTISNITNADPAVVTSGNHGLSTNDSIYIYGVTGMGGINKGPYLITVVDDNTFTMAVDTQGFNLYSNGGVITDLEFFSSKAWKRVYAGGTGYQHKIQITSTGKDKPVKIHAFMPWFKKRGRVI